jgi:hypothetical protein
LVIGYWLLVTDGASFHSGNDQLTEHRAIDVCENMGSHILTPHSRNDGSIRHTDYEGVLVQENQRFSGTFPIGRGYGVADPFQLLGG